LAQTAQKDTLRINRLDDYFYIYPWSGAPKFTIQFDSTGTKDSSFSRSYSINSRNLIGFAFGYKKLFLSLGFKTPYEVIPEYPDVKSSSFNLGANYRSKKLNFEFAYKKFKGFYDPSALTDTTKQREVRNDFYYRYYKLKAIYLFSPQKFSYNAAYLYKEWQRKSGGSFLVLGEFWSSKMTADSAFLPEDLTQYNAYWEDVNGAHINSLGAAGGYSFTLVAFKRFFFSAFLAVGLDIQHKTYDYTQGHSSKSFITTAGTADSRASFGFNSTRFFVTIAAKNDFNFSRAYGIRTTATYNIVSFNIGYRFIPPKLIRDLYDVSPFNRGLKHYLPKRSKK